MPRKDSDSPEFKENGAGAPQAGKQRAKRRAENDIDEAPATKKPASVAETALAAKTAKLERGHKLDIGSVKDTEFTLEQTCVCGRKIQTATYDIRGDTYAHRESRLSMRWWYYDQNGTGVTCCLGGVEDFAKRFHNKVPPELLFKKPETTEDFAALKATRASIKKLFPVDDWLFRRGCFSHSTEFGQVVPVSVQYALGLGGKDHNDVPPPYTKAREENGLDTEIDGDTARTIDRKLSLA